jgi:hypothetical protein
MSSRLERHGAEMELARAIPARTQAHGVIAIHLSAQLVAPELSVGTLLDGLIGSQYETDLPLQRASFQSVAQPQLVDN